MFQLKDLFSASFYKTESKKELRQKKIRDDLLMDELNDLERSTIKMKSSRLKNKKSLVLGLQNLNKSKTNSKHNKALPHESSSILENNPEIIENSNHKSKMAGHLRMMGLSSDSESEQIPIENIRLNNLSSGNKIFHKTNHSGNKLSQKSVSSFNVPSEFEKRGKCSIDISLKPLINKNRPKNPSKPHN